MDEFSWFVGIYEGEGSFYSRTCKRKAPLKDGTERVYEHKGLVLTIKMTDEDVISRAAKFLGQSYAEVERADRDARGYKRCYRVRQMGGNKGKLRKLLDRMYPYLSKRRQEQITKHLNS